MYIHETLLWRYKYKCKHVMSVLDIWDEIFCVSFKVVRA